MQHAAPQPKAGCNNTKYQQKKIQATPKAQPKIPPKSNGHKQYQKNKKSGEDCQSKEVIVTIAKQDAANGKKPTIHKTHYSEAKEAKETRPMSGRPRKTLAPFKKISQDSNLKRSQEKQCQEADQTIMEAFRTDRDARFSRMGTWRITKKISRNGAVCLRTEATEKLAHLLGKIEDPTKRIAFFE